MGGFKYYAQRLKCYLCDLRKARLTSLRPSPYLYMGTCVCARVLGHVQLFAIAWTVACQAFLSMRFSKQEYWSGCHFLLQGIFPTRDWTCISCISCIGRWLLYQCATWEALYIGIVATHSSVLAWRILGAGKPGGLPSMGSHRVGHDWSDLA